MRNIDRRSVMKFIDLGDVREETKSFQGPGTDGGPLPNVRKIIKP